MKGGWLIAFTLFIAVAANAQQKGYYPAPKGFVNDYEGIFNTDELKNLDIAVKDLLSKTMEESRLYGLEIAVVTVTDSMYGDSKAMADYASVLGDKWRLGSKPPNRSIIIAYSRQIRQVSILAGSGLDAVLPPDACTRVINERMLPQFRKGKYYDAILAGINGLQDYLLQNTK